MYDKTTSNTNSFFSSSTNSASKEIYPEETNYSEQKIMENALRIFEPNNDLTYVEKREKLLAIILADTEEDTRVSNANLLLVINALILEGANKNEPGIINEIGKFLHEFNITEKSDGTDKAIEIIRDTEFLVSLFTKNFTTADEYWKLISNNQDLATYYLKKGLVKLLGIAISNKQDDVIDKLTSYIKELMGEQVKDINFYGKLNSYLSYSAIDKNKLIKTKAIYYFLETIAPIDGITNNLCKQTSEEMFTKALFSQNKAIFDLSLEIMLTSKNLKNCPFKIIYDNFYSINTFYSYLNNCFHYDKNTVERILDSVTNAFFDLPKEQRQEHYSLKRSYVISKKAINDKVVYGKLMTRAFCSQELWERFSNIVFSKPGLSEEEKFELFNLVPANISYSWIIKLIEQTEKYLLDQNQRNALAEKWLCFNNFHAILQDSWETIPLNLWNKLCDTSKEILITAYSYQPPSEDKNNNSLT